MSDVLPADDSVGLLPEHGWAVPKKLVWLAAPMIASMMSRTVMSFVDFAMVSKLGTNAMAAIMPAGMMLFLPVGFGMGLLSLVNTFVSQSLGRNKLRDCSAYAWQGVYLALLLGVVFIPLWPLVPAFFEWVGHGKDAMPDGGMTVIEMETVYLRYGLLSIAPMLVHTALGNFFNGIHKPMVGFWAMLIANIFNIVGNYALIFGNWGFEPMGIEGAAIATLGAAILQAAIMLGWMLLPSYQARYGSMHTWKPDWKKLKGLMSFGAPAGAQFVVDIASWTIFTLFLVGRFGEVQLAAHNLVFKLLEVCFMPTFGLSIAVTAIVGKAIGENRRHLARVYVRWAVLFSFVYMGSIAIAFFIFRKELPGIFTDDVEVIEWAATLMIFAALFEFFDAFIIPYMGALRGAGDNHWPLYVFIGGGITIFMGGGFAAAYLKPEWGSAGPWAAATVYVIVVSIFMSLRWILGAWEKINVFKHDDDHPADPDALSAQVPSD
jgi:MATE family multidrug resistance protein